MALIGCDYVIDDDLTVACDKSYAAGIRKGYFINRVDVAGYTKATSSADYNIITDIQLVTGAAAYELTDIRTTPFEGSSKALGDGALRAKTTKTIQFLFYSKGPAAARIVDAFKSNKFVVILATEDVANEDKAAFEVYGLETGAKCTAYEVDIAAGDYDNTYLITLECTETQDGVYWWDTDYATTKGKVEALLPSTGGVSK